MLNLAYNLDGNERLSEVVRERTSIGRDPRNDIVIDNAFVSGFHAELVKIPSGGYEIVDLKSSNGTFVNGRRVEREPVKAGDRISLGELNVHLRQPALPKPGASTGSVIPIAVCEVEDAESPEMKQKKEALEKAIASLTKERGEAETVLGKIKEENETLGKVMLELKTNREAEQAQVEALSKRREALEKEAREFESQKTAVANSLTESRDALTKAEDQLKSRQQKIDEELALLNKSSEAEKTLVEGLATRRSELEKELLELENQKNTATKSLAEIRESLAKSEEQLGTRQKEVEAAMLALTQKSETEKNQIEELASRRAELAKEIQELDTQKVAVSSTLAEGRESLTKAEAQRESHHQEIKEAQATLESLEAKTAGLKVEHETLQSKLEQLQGKVHSEQEAADRLTAACAAHQSLVEAAEQKVAGLQKEAEEWQAKVTALQSQKEAQAEAIRLQTSQQEALEQRLSFLRGEADSMQKEVALKLRDLAVAEGRERELLDRILKLESRTTELAAGEGNPR